MPLSSNLFKVFVGNLSWSTCSKDLRTHFSKFGSVKIANSIFDKTTGLHKGYGFVIFNTKEDYDRVLAENHKIDGNVVEVQSVIAKY